MKCLMLLLFLLSSWVVSSTKIVITHPDTLSIPGSQQTVFVPKYSNYTRCCDGVRFHVVSSVDHTLRVRKDVYDIVDNPSITHAETTSQWNLDRIDQSFGRDGVYNPAPQYGSTVDVYVVDTGVDPTRPIFNGRVQPGYNAFDANLTTMDTNGHGTLVASTCCGLTYGVAREALIFPVVALDSSGTGSVMSLAIAISWVLDSMSARPGRKAVVNLSIQAEANTVIDQLTQSLYESGAVVVVAAGNFADDACNYSPSRSSYVVSAGAIDTDDSIASFSNYGSCVTLYAPGVNIQGASPDSSAIAMMSGTSFASPITAGVVSTLWDRYPSLNQAQIIQLLTKQVATTLGLCADDQDCSGSLQGQLLLQTIDAETTSPNSLNRTSLVVTNNDFTIWSPTLMLDPTDGGGCVQFQTSASAFQVVLSSDVLLNGLDVFSQTPITCRDNNAKWVTATVTTNSVNLAYYTLPSFSSSPSTVLKHPNTYVIQYTTVNVSMNGSHLLMSSTPVRYLSFATTSPSTSITIDNIVSCATPTSSPTLSPVAAPATGEASSSVAVVTKKNMGFFFKWFPVSSSSVITWKTSMSSKIIVGFVSNIPTGRVKYTTSGLYVLVVTRKSVVLQRNGITMASTTNKNLTINNKNTVTTFRLTLETTSLLLEMNTTQQGWITLASLSTPPAMPTSYFSLTSSTRRTFKNVK
jgi:hypothetical protein